MNTPLHILHLEDEPKDAEIIHETLSAANIAFDVLCVGSKEEYVGALQHGKFDLILSDFTVPAFDGLSALSIAKTLRPEVPFIFVSATIGEERAIDSLQLGATDYVQKDRLNRLGPSIRRALSEVEERRKRTLAEERLRESEEQFRLIAENMADLVAVLDLEGKRLYDSPSYTTILGSPELLRGRDSFTDIHPDDRQRVTKIFHDIVRTGVGQRTEYRLVSKNGDTRFIESQRSVIKDDKGKPTRVIVVSRDVTERKSLEEQLRQAQKLESLGTLAGGIAHDFNNILGIIMGHSTLLRTGKTDPARISNSAGVIEQSAQRGAALVRQLLTFARKTDVVFESVSVNNIVKEVARLLEGIFPKLIVISLGLQDRLPSIVADSTQLHQVLMNLCVNARDAMLPQGGVLSISTELLGGDIIRKRFPKAAALEYELLTIADTGTGMDEATRLRIFEPFFTTKEKGKGTGLGLATVFGIVKAHHGIVDVISAVDKGTTFLVYFPVPSSQSAIQETSIMPAAEVPGGSETVLVVEDEELLRVLLVSALESGGYHVLTACDGAEAMAVFSQSKVDINLVLTDLGLPKVDGEALMLGLKEINPAIRVIVVSGYMDPERRSRLLRSGAKELISKPVKPDDLLKKVREVLDC